MMMRVIPMIVMSILTAAIAARISECEASETAGLFRYFAARYQRLALARSGQAMS